MLKSLAALLGLGFVAFFALFALSDDRPSSYSSYVARMQFVPFPKEKVLIYGATRYFGSPMFSEDIVSKRCPKDTALYCQFTNNETRSKEADAWLYHNRDFSPKIWENYTRSSRQMHVMFTQESPVHESIFFPPGTVNWTMTYRRDSDVFWPYGVFEARMFNRTMNNDTIWEMKIDNRTASWMVSNCKTGNRRMDIAKKAKRLGLNLDIYGGCNKAKKIKNCPRYSANRSECAARVLSKYFFYLSFENSNCEDYVTEKFYNALRLYYAVPVVIKRDIYTKMGFPPKSFIAVDDFNSIEKMVSFLNELKENKTEYLSYHSWRNDYEVISDSDSPDVGICALCRRLRVPVFRPKSYPNLRNWFSPSKCDNAYALKYLT